MASRRKLAALIFDVDGTLVDSNELHARAWQEAFREFDKEFPIEVVRSQIGKGGDLLVPDLLNAREMQKFGEKVRKFRKKLFRKEYLPKVKPFPGIREAFQVLADWKIRIALASSADPDEVDHFVELLDIEDLIETTTSAGDAELSKPSPEIFEAARAKLKTPKTRVATVGDTPYDVLASHRAALPIAAVRSGGFPEESLEKAEFLFDDVPDLVRRIAEVEHYFDG